MYGRASRCCECAQAVAAGVGTKLYVVACVWCGQAIAAGKLLLHVLASCCKCVWGKMLMSLHVCVCEQAVAASMREQAVRCCVTHAQAVPTERGWELYGVVAGGR